ncbi:MAG: acyloxyacyl hydrolase [Rickettsiales bacterium]
MKSVNKVVFLTSVISSVLAFNSSISLAEENNKDYITGYIGYFDVIRNDYTSTQFGIEYRARPIKYNVRPMVGINVTTDKSVYGYAGLSWDVELIDNQLYLIPNFAAGLYTKGDGKELGGAIEFRSGIELAYKFPNEHRLGLAFNHISNASIYKHNPGSEAALLTYSVPMDQIIRY